MNNACFQYINKACYLRPAQQINRKVFSNHEQGCGPVYKVNHWQGEVTGKRPLEALIVHDD